MRWCAQCQRYLSGRPTYCPSCGRTFTVRLCRRGHANSRNVTFCSQCGSDDLSTAAPAESWSIAAIHHLPTMASPLVGAAVALVILFNWVLVFPYLLAAIVILGGMYVATGVLPPATRRVAWRVMRKTWKAVHSRTNR